MLLSQYGSVTKMMLIWHASK